MIQRALARWGAAPALLASAVGAHAQPAPPGGPPPGGAAGRGPQWSYANPSAAIAAELEFARLAQEKGQWTAFRAMAADDAVMLAPGMVLAHAWLKNRPNPAVALRWSPQQVWSSCDGSLMITHGAWRRGETHGWFTTVWRRERDGRYRWVFDHGDTAREAVAAPDMIATRVADCPPRAARPSAPPSGARGRGKPPKSPKPAPVPFDPLARQGRSNDGSLTWRVTADRAGAREFTARLLGDGEMREIRREHVAAGGGS